MTQPRSLLLAAKEPQCFRVINASAGGNFVFTCDHASARIPLRLQNLGLTSADLARHIAWDLGAAEVTVALSEHLDAWAILQNYSRLVIDCNRPLAAPDSMVASSDGIRIPGNHALSDSDRAMRRDEIFQPYHSRITEQLDGRRSAGRPTLLVAVHSFTPVWEGRPRPWEAGVLYHRDPRVARILLEQLRAEHGAVIGDNEPYSLSDTTDFTIPVHGEQRRLPHVEVELRQDLIASAAGRANWVERLANALRCAEIKLLSYAVP